MSCVKIAYEEERYEKLKEIVESKGLEIGYTHFSWNIDGTALRSVDIKKPIEREVKKGIPLINRRTEKIKNEKSIARFSKSSHKTQFLDDEWIVDVNSRKHLHTLKEIMKNVEEEIDVSVKIRITPLSTDNLDRV
jgi:hypothetical protein